MSYIPNQTHKGLYDEISKLVEDGKSYLEIGKVLLPDIDPYQAKGIIWRAHKKNKWTVDNEIREMLGLPRFVYVQYDPTKVSVPRCSSCGKVHAFDRACEMEVIIKEKPKPKRRKWQEIKTEDLRWALENRHPPNGWIKSEHP